MVVSSFSDLAGTKDLARQAVNQITRAGAMILSASTRSGLAVDGTVESIEDFLEALKLQSGRRHQDCASTSFAALIEAHVKEATHRRGEEFRRWLAAESQRARPHRTKECRDG